MQSVQQVLDQFGARGASAVFGISIDHQFVQAAQAKHLGLSYPLLGDPNREASRAFRVLLEEPLAGVRDVSDRAVFVVGKDGKIRYAWLGEIKGQPDMNAVLAALA